jgi:hypothetical protein
MTIQKSGIGSNSMMSSLNVYYEQKAEPYCILQYSTVQPVIQKMRGYEKCEIEHWKDGGSTPPAFS